MKKTIFCAIALASAMTLAFAGCGGGKDPGPGPGPKPGDTISNPWWTTTGELDMDGGSPVFEDVELTLSTIVNGEDLAGFNQIIAQFNNAYRGKISIEVNSVNQNDYESTVMSQITQNNNPPDLIMTHQKMLKSFVEQKTIQPFDEAMEQSGIEISLSDYAADLAKYASLGYDGYTFSVPIDAQCQVIYYNKQILAKYGGELPTNHEELVELCNTVAAGENIVPIAWDTSLEFFPMYTFLTAVIQNGGDLYDESDYTVHWSEGDNLTAFTNAIKSIRDLVKHTPQLARWDAGAGALSDFLAQKALFFLGMPWNFNSIVESFGAQNGNLSKDAVLSGYIGGTSISNWFALEENENSDKIFGDAHFFAISKSVRDINKKAAICEFVKWFTQTASVGALWAEAGHISGSTVVTNSDEYIENEFVNDYITHFYPDINRFECIGNTPYHADLISSITKIFATTKNNTTAEQDKSAITAAQTELNGIITFF